MKRIFLDRKILGMTKQQTTTTASNNTKKNNRYAKEKQ